MNMPRLTDLTKGAPSLKKGMPVVLGIDRKNTGISLPQAKKIFKKKKK